MPTSKTIKGGSLIQCWVKKERSGYLTHKKTLTCIQKDTYISVEGGSRVFRYKKGALEVT